MKIGITERGDAGLNMVWVEKLKTVDMTVLITKNITKIFAENVIKAHNAGHKLIVHCTCTGYGGSELEPNVPNYKTQLNSLKTLIDMGFPSEQCVLRIDPIFPSEKGLQRVRDVLEYFRTLNINVLRIRVSIVDEYRHVKERYRQRGWESLYGDNMYASAEQVQMVADVLNSYNYCYEVCAENHLAKKLKAVSVSGCVSIHDMDIFGLPYNIDEALNPQNRSGCHCLKYKTELLTEKKPCPNGCVYCFWKNS